MAAEKILIVDDDPDLVRAVQAILESVGYRTATAADRAGAEAHIGSAKPDLIILDVMMATWDEGFDMARQLKGDPETRDVPILMLTGIRRKRNIDIDPVTGRGIGCPVDGFLDKPADPDVLLAEIARLLQD